MASNSAEEEPELEDPLSSFKCTIWKHFPVKHVKGICRLDEPEQGYKLELLMLHVAQYGTFLSWKSVCQYITLICGWRKRLW